MGYYKQLDATWPDGSDHPVFAPKPATSHVALTRKALRPHRKSTPLWVPLAFGGLFVFVAGLGVGVVL